jgi:ATP-binding cassette, subfamily B, bacterial
LLQVHPALEKVVTMANADAYGSNSNSAPASRTIARLQRLHAAVRFALPQRHAILLIVVLVLVVAGFNAFEPLVLKSVFDQLTGPEHATAILLGILLLLGFAVAREIMEGFANWLTWRTRIGLQYALLEATIGKLHRMPLRMQRSEGIGAIMTRLDRSIQGFTSAVTAILFNIMPAVIFLIIAIAIMLRLEWRLALLVLAFAPLPALVAASAGPEQMQRERTLLDRGARIYSRFNEVLSGILIVRSFAIEDAEKARFLRDVADANKVVIQGVAVDAGYASASNLVVGLARLAGLGLGAYFVIRARSRWAPWWRSWAISAGCSDRCKG